MRRKNIFVIGDLVIDHTLFVRVDFERPHQAVPGKDIYEVLSRQDDAGGGANTARILSIVNEGKTFLWGIIGASPWGDFRSILMNSDKHSEPLNPIEFRGVQDETDAQMNTISRIILIDHSAIPCQLVHKVRFDDYGHAHVTEMKRKSVLHYLRRTNEKYGIDAIIINDLDYGCLNVEIIKEIAGFANRQTPRIPIFVDPKLEKRKYEDIEATAIMPNLVEWCHLVGIKGTAKKWRNRLNNPACLKEMAELSLSKLGNFKYHIIKCDKDGAVIIAPHPDKDNYNAVYQVPPAKTKNQSLPHQLGCGDVMTGMFALEFSIDKESTENVLKSFLLANSVVGCYREMPWHRMPTLASVKEALNKVDVQKLPEPLSELSTGRLFFPKQQLELFKYETAIPGLYSKDSSYLNSVKTLLDEISSGWGPGHLKSIILLASSGSGKSKIAKWLEKNLYNQSSIKAINLTNRLSTTFEGTDITRKFNELLDKESTPCKQMLIIVDEILKSEKNMSFLEEFGITLLNSAHHMNVRFLFIDADFRSQKKQERLGSQFTSRCRRFHLSSLAERPKDIPIIAVAEIKEYAKKNNHELVRIKIDGQALLAIINQTLVNPNTRELCNFMDDIYRKAINRAENKGKQDTLHVKYADYRAISVGTLEEGNIPDYFEFFVR